MKKKYSVAVVGVGAVGVEMLRCLKQRSFPVGNLSVFARSSRTIHIDNQAYEVKTISAEGFTGVDIALFAGTEGAKGAAVTYASEVTKRGGVVIDNGADFRLKEDVPLVVPEVNRASISSQKGIIANPNCTTIQMVVALNEIYKRFGLSQVVLTSFQATSGGGKEAAQTLWDETCKLVEINRTMQLEKLNKELKQPFDVFGSQIAFNVIPKIGGFSDDDYTSEEWKTVHETHKIFDDSSITITATCVRVGVITSHSEAIYFKTRSDASLDMIEEALQNSEGVVYMKASYGLPQPLPAEGKDDVFVGRLRRDPYNKNCFWLWCVADNLRKGAALNAVQIAESLIA